MLEIKNLHASVEGQEILKGLNLTINPGEVHSIMGPNGSGKSTLAQVLAGRDSYEVTEGEIIFEGKDLLELAPEERACEGIFMAFQYPVEIPGVANTYLLREALNSVSLPFTIKPPEISRVCFASTRINLPFACVFISSTNF